MSRVPAPRLSMGDPAWQPFKLTTIMDEFWSIAHEFFPSEALLARQKDCDIPSETSNPQKDYADRNECAFRIKDSADFGRRSMHRIRKPKEHISFLPQPSTDTKDMNVLHLSGPLGRSIETSLRSFVSNMNQFDKLYSHDRFFTRAWQEDARPRRSERPTLPFI